MSPNHTTYTCQHCGSEFTPPYRRSQKEPPKFCSIPCRAAHTKAGYEQRFWTYVQKTDSCWLWTGGCFKDGYGSIGYKGRSRRATRLSYELAYGPFDPLLDVLHTCDNPKCVRPDHLFLGTQADNMHDMDQKGRRSVANRAVGERQHSAKLTADDVRAIRTYLTHGASIRNVAARYGVDKSTITAIRDRKTWRHVP